MVAVAATGAWQAGAQIGDPGGVPLPTTTTAPPQSTTTTATGSATTTDTTEPETTSTTQPVISLPGEPTTTTTAPGGQSTTTTSTPAGGTGSGGPPVPAPVPVPGVAEPAVAEPAADGTAPAGAAGPFPVELKALMDAVVRTRASNTGKLLDALRALEDFGLTPPEAAVVGMGRFPVAGYATYSHDWLYPRFGPGWRLHQGTDIFAAHGTPVRSPVDGTVRLTQGGLGGISTYVHMADGTYFYLTHLSGYPEGLLSGQQVRTGQVVGFVGDTGNARGGSPHLHFEIHPGGGPAIDPKSHLDQWLVDALAQVPAVVAHYRASQPAILTATGLTRRLAGGTGAVYEPTAAPPRAQLLWASSMSPAGGPLRLAEARAASAAVGIDWDGRARRELARSVAWHEADEAARALLQPLLPPTLGRFFADR